VIKSFPRRVDDDPKCGEEESNWINDVIYFVHVVAVVVHDQAVTSIKTEVFFTIFCLAGSPMRQPTAVPAGLGCHADPLQHRHFLDSRVLSSG
jgi:hypothetical protein